MALEMNLHPTKTNPLLRKSDHSIVFLELPEFFPSVQETAHITGTHSLSLSSVHFLLRTATIEIETCDFFRTMLFFSLYPFIFRFFYWNFSLPRMPFFSITVRNFLLDSFYLCLYLSISVSLFLPLPLSLSVSVVYMGVCTAARYWHWYLSFVFYTLPF